MSTPNVVLEKKGKDLVITVKDIEKADFGASRTGKSQTVASTYGNADISSLVGRPGTKLGLNVYTIRSER